MSSRGRGFSGRGGYSNRGSSYRGSYRGSSRGSYEGSRGGRGGYSSFSNESRYNSGDRYGSGRDRMDDSFKKSYRSESNSYSGRDYGRSGSPERKRMRTEGGGGHYGSYVSERRTFDDRRRSPSRDGYRKSMAPPRSPPRSSRTRMPRRSFRGRSLRTRAPFRSSIRTRGSYSRPTYTKVFRSMKSHSSIKSKGDSASSTEEDWDADEKDVEHEEKKEVKKSPKASEEQIEEDEIGGEEGEEGEETDKGEDAASEDDVAHTSRPKAKSATLLVCVHCKDKSNTYTGYMKHLLLSKHRAAMSNVARRHKSQLIRMRLAQRRAQRDIESDGGAPLASRTTFCPVCRLNYRTTRHAHNLSDSHRAMKRFLNPNCRVCRITFRSPMVYEHHLCQLEHIKRKNQARRPSPKAEAGSADEGMDVDLENFMTLDSVGDVDEVDDESGGEKKEEEEEEEVTPTPKKPKVEINIGSEHIKKMEVWFCELCRVYLPRAEAGSAEETEARRRHCRLRIHLGRYVQHRDTRTLRKHAERIHRQLHQQKETEKDDALEDSKLKDVKVEVVEDKKKVVENGTTTGNNASVGDDKLWADVDKDIGDLLREVDPQGNEGSDDDVDLDRYDKFRKSDKKVEGKDDDPNESSDKKVVDVAA